MRSKLKNERSDSVNALLRRSPLPPEETELLLVRVLDMSRERLLAHPETPLTRWQRWRMARLIESRRRGAPLSYLTRRASFFGNEFHIHPGALIPRPETEWLVERGLTVLDEQPDLAAVIDVGTGSGAIILSLAKAWEATSKKTIIWYGTDCSRRALRLARANARQLGISTVQWGRGNLLAPILPLLRDMDVPVLILANLPYLNDHDYTSAPHEVRRFEPKLALYGGHDGLDLYRALVKQLHALPHLAGNLMLEADPCNVRDLAALVRSAWPRADATIHSDQAGHERYVTAAIVAP